MNYNEANEMAAKFTEIGGFTKIEVSHFGSVSEMTPEVEADGMWEVHTWIKRNGNANLEIVKDYAPKHVKALARKAKGTATARDRETFAAIAAERAAN